MHIPSLLLLSSAWVLGLRHGIDWDHIAAIFDIVGARSDKRALPVGLFYAFLYALGHALAVVVLGVAALQFTAILPAWVDTVMERVVGITLVLLGFYLIRSVMRFARGNGELRLASRWMLLLQAGRQVLRHVSGFFARQSAAAGPPAQASASQALDCNSGHNHNYDYGAKTAFSIGMLHGIGAETGTQVLLVAAVGGASSYGQGIAMLLAFVAGLLTSNMILSLLLAGGTVSATRFKPLFIGAGSLAACFSIALGVCFIAGQAEMLPSLN